jgi:hypothetical protein
MLPRSLRIAVIPAAAGCLLLTAMMGRASSQALSPHEGVFLPRMRAPASEPVPGYSEKPQFRGEVATLELESGPPLLVRIVSLRQGELVATVAGVRQVFPMTRIDRLFVRGDSLKNGALIGGLLGTLGGALLRGGECVYSSCGIGGEIASTMAGVGIGIAIDAGHIGQTVVFARRKDLR